MRVHEDEIAAGNFKYQEGNFVSPTRCLDRELREFSQASVAFAIPRSESQQRKVLGRRVSPVRKDKTQMEDDSPPTRRVSKSGPNWVCPEEKVANVSSKIFLSRNLCEGNLSGSVKGETISFKDSANLKLKQLDRMRIRREFAFDTYLGLLFHRSGKLWKSFLFLRVFGGSCRYN
ncbi:hypothetical protein K0M31_019738 [Melipona bicolor]|uniref:Uncharacterized protein n=1 Tax=Melipona bicolor TaxID=60889 RepID=A0AA40G3N0_9HYME|nr:hypothetical protein K0M31_019738 [Melipona bicolor]